MQVAGIDSRSNRSYHIVMSRDSLLQHALSLSLDERVQLVDDLLHSMVASDSCPELSPAQQNDLLQRLSADHADPNAAVSWEEAEKQITSTK
jgi:putative addiction module component (TIGR02574 family)